MIKTRLLAVQARCSTNSSKKRSQRLLLTLLRSSPLGTFLLRLFPLLCRDDGGLSKKVLKAILRLFTFTFLEALDRLGDALLGKLLLVNEIPGCGSEGRRAAWDIKAHEYALANGAIRAVLKMAFL